MVMDHQFGTDEGSFITMREIGKYTGIPLHRKVGQFGSIEYIGLKRKIEKKSNLCLTTEC